MDVGPPEGDHRANSRAEVAVRETKGQCRSMRLHAEHKRGVKLRDDHPAPAWAPRVAGHVLSTVKIGEDGRTAEQRRTGKPWKKFAIPFFENVMTRRLGEMRYSNYASRMVEGRLIGYHMPTGAVLLMTEDGIIRGRGVNGLAEDEACCEGGGEGGATTSVGRSMGAGPAVERRVTD